ncbi:MAG: hypothetical protein K2O56_03275 [Muribaculaceae bacterium]|nr:hypothetical protein [Muribaculaceae bacterium]
MNIFKIYIICINFNINSSVKRFSSVVSRRFDLTQSGKRLHAATDGALLCISLGTKIKLPETVCRRIIEDVADNCGNLLRYKLK